MMKERMEKLLAEGEELVSDLMWWAQNNLHDFWDNHFAYRKDGEYAISNFVVGKPRSSGRTKKELLILLRVFLASHIGNEAWTNG